MADHLRLFLRSEVVMAVGSDSAPGLVWSECSLPTLCNVDPLRRLGRGSSLNLACLFDNESSPTLFEASDGNWEDVASSLATAQRTSVRYLSTVFTSQVLISSIGPRTRIKLWRCWRGIHTWSIARHCLHQLLPMHKDVLRALLMDLVALHCSFSTIKGYLDSIQFRHRRYDLTSPVRGLSSYQRVCRTLKRFQGRQAPYKFPIHRALVAQVLKFPAPTLTCKRDCLAAALATVCCLRPSEGARLQSCDVFFDFDVASGLPGFRGTAAVNVMSRKNDQCRKGHHPRIGRSHSSALNLVHQIQVYFKHAGLGPREGCQKRKRPHARCPLCPPLFPLSVRGRDWQSVMTDRPPSPAAFSEMIVRALGYVGCDVSAFSGVCARRGGLSTAIEAGVPEPILWLQSGHAQTKSASRTYMRLRNPELLYATWKAFNL